MSININKHSRRVVWAGGAQACPPSVFLKGI